MIRPPIKPRADAPTGLPDVIELAFFGLEFDVEGAAEILAEVVAGAGLQREAVLHHGFDGVGAHARRRIFRRCVFWPLITGMAMTFSATSA